MKVKTCITLSKDLLAKVDQAAGSRQSRPAFIETVLRKYLWGRQHAKVQTRDLDLLNRAADRLNMEAEGVLEYQLQNK